MTRVVLTPFGCGEGHAFRRWVSGNARASQRNERMRRGSDPQKRVFTCPSHGAPHGHVSMKRLREPLGAAKEGTRSLAAKMSGNEACVRRYRQRRV